MITILTYLSLSLYFLHLIYLYTSIVYFSILVYDVTQKDTFANLETWLNEADQFSTGVGKEAVKLLVGNKVDLPRVVERSEAEAWAKERNMLFIEASAKTTEGITQVFNEAVQKVCRLIFYDDDDDDDDDDIIMKIMKGYVDNEVVDEDADNYGD